MGGLLQSRHIRRHRAAHFHLLLVASLGRVADFTATATNSSSASLVLFGLGWGSFLLLLLFPTS